MFNQIVDSPEKRWKGIWGFLEPAARKEKEVRMKILFKRVGELKPSVTVQVAVPELDRKNYKRVMEDMKKKRMLVEIEVTAGRDTKKIAEELGLSVLPCMEKELVAGGVNDTKGYIPRLLIDRTHSLVSTFLAVMSWIDNCPMTMEEDFN